MCKSQKNVAFFFFSKDFFHCTDMFLMSVVVELFSVKEAFHTYLFISFVHFYQKVLWGEKFGNLMFSSLFVSFNDCTAFHKVKFVLNSVYFPSLKLVDLLNLPDYLSIARE